MWYACEGAGGAAVVERIMMAVGDVNHGDEVIIMGNQIINNDALGWELGLDKDVYSRISKGL